MLAGLPLWANVLVFLVSAGLVWAAGTRLAYFADAIARRTGLGQAAIGVLLLGGITSLPEIAVTGAASWGGDAALAVNNLLGGFAMQVVILAFADATFGRAALTSTIPNPIVLLQGVLGILLVALIAAGIGTGDMAFLGAGFWTWGIFGAFLYALRLVTAAEGRPAWQVIGQPPAPELGEAEPEVERSARRLALSTAAAAAVIFVAGYALARASEALAEQTGLGSSLFGAVFVAIATSLPEISTVLAAIRLGRHVMATSDILGTNLFDIALIFLVDLIYAGDPVLNEVGAFSQVAAMLGITVTGVFVVGMIERRDPAIRGIGLDSLIVGAAYLGGLGLLFHLR
ncbi:MAG: sodium:calcium antiporter [Geminicoccaceae bacterium]|nr:sodium:calcium antiporter [Geminicoccaceae bacterium]MCB9969235.1 sodium:calcium antiporter [Geminicoccaceae bacterium]HRY25118.1 sodium:calcium antiporter [Geminicoccaceae bacterium]